MDLSRRQLLQSGTAAAGALAFGPGLVRTALAAPARAGASPYGPLGPADANGLELPPGFSSRMIARGIDPVAGTGYTMPVFPDGQATYRTGDGGWILVTNAESLDTLGAGSSAIRFTPSGVISRAYRILGGTNTNCAGGPTPWGTWLSGEETEDGMIWECDPAGVLPAEARPALGVFPHEAAAVDPVGGAVFLTEDRPDGNFYRFTPDRFPDLTKGTLEVAAVAASGKVAWKPVPDPTTIQSGTATRLQVPEATDFNGGEGIWYARGFCYFTTKGDKKVWAYDTAKSRIEVLFDRQLALDSSLDAVDNVTVSAVGDVLVCEDGGNLEIGLITSDREVSPLIRFSGADHAGSEVCGVVFDPSGTRLYFTSQRAFPAIAPVAPGAVYEVTGPFRLPKGGVPKDLVYGPPAGEARPGGPLNPGADGKDPKGKVKAPKRIARKAFARDGIAVTVKVDEASTVAVRLDTHALAQRPGIGGVDAATEARGARQAQGTGRARRRAGEAGDPGEEGRARSARSQPRRSPGADSGLDRRRSGQRERRLGEGPDRPRLAQARRRPPVSG